jgi:hypothetical protein
MTETTISREYFAIALTSEMGLSSARKMKATYLENAGNDTNNPGPVPDPGNSGQGTEIPGPNAMVYLTRISTRTPAGEINKILQGDPDLDQKMRNCVFYTEVFTIRIRMDDPSTTRFINATISWDVPPDTKILDYSPKGKEVIAGIIETGADGISITPALVFRVTESPGPETGSAGQVHRFEARTGPEECLYGTYTKKSGFILKVPAGVLLEYQGIRKNKHAVYWELYPPITPRDVEISGKEDLAVFSLIIQAPKNSSPDITARIEGRVKGNLWGVIHLTGSGSIPV